MTYTLDSIIMSAPYMNSGKQCKYFLCYISHFLTLFLENGLNGVHISTIPLSQGNKCHEIFGKITLPSMQCSILFYDGKVQMTSSSNYKKIKLRSGFIIFLFLFCLFSLRMTAF